ncbi:MAG: hypothetical protein H7123_08615 [Thermoleophilia bacterium]|nr:hypothetical protein [Thermoleophilia bacterium]
MELVHSTETSEADLAVEAAAHATLRLVGDLPGRFGRLRAARILGGRPISPPPAVLEGQTIPIVSDNYAVYVLEHSWRLADLCDLIDAMLSGGLLERTPGMRPTLVLTRAGHRALEALENGSSGPLVGPS